MVIPRIPKAIMPGSKVLGRFAALKIAYPIGYIINTTTKRETPPYVSAKHGINTARTTNRAPINLTMIFANDCAAPVTSITLPKMAPNKKVGNQEIKYSPAPLI